MSEAMLEPAELEAIQAAIRETAPRASSRAAASDIEPTRLALLSDDRVAEAARPVLVNLGTRWTRPLTRALKAHLPGQWQVDPTGVEIIDGGIAREELRGGWVGTLSGSDGEIVVAAHGALIDVAAAKRCGATDAKTDGNRPPSPVSLRLFQPAGRSILDSWNLAWREIREGDLGASVDLGIVSRMIQARALLRLALTFRGDLAGRIALYVRPEMLVAAPAALAAVKARAALVANALANVPVEVVAELGTLRLRLHEIKKLAPGATYTLQGFVDSRVPVYCEGVLKAWARPVVYRGVIGLQVESVVHDQGSKS